MGITINPKKQSGGGGGVTGAESGTGIVSGKVRLGINPLLQDTQITNDGHAFDVVGATGSGFSEAELSVIGTEFEAASLDDLGNQKSIQIDSSSGEGIFFIDQVDNVGPVTDKSYMPDPNVGPTFNYLPNNIDGRQLLTQDVVPYIFQIIQQRNITGTGAVNFNYSSVSNVFDCLVRLNVAVFINSISGGTVFSGSFNYKDEGGTNQVINIGPYSALNAAAPIMPFVLYIQKVTAVHGVFSWNIDGGSANVYTMLEVLNVAN